MPDYRDIASNKKAYHDYFISDKFEAGIELRGTEIKAIRDGRVNLKDSYVQIFNGQAYVYQMHISPYDHGSFFNHEPMRVRRLLLHKKEIEKLTGIVAQKGFTLVPLRMYLKGRYAKLEFGVAKGKQHHDKRASLQERDVKREMDRTMKNYNRK